MDDNTQLLILFIVFLLIAPRIVDFVRECVKVLDEE